MKNDLHFFTKQCNTSIGVVHAVCYRDSVVLDDTKFEDFKVLCTANFEFGQLRNPTKVIAVSGGAVNALEAFCKEGKSKYYDNVDFVAITHTYRDKLAFQENNVHKLVFDAEEMQAYRKRDDNSLLYHALNNVVGDDTRHVIFVHTFGSTSPDVYLQYLKGKNITITLLATKPYLFESMEKRERVEKQLIQSKKHTDHLFIIDAEDVRKAHPKMTLGDAYTHLDKAIGEKIESILSKQ